MHIHSLQKKRICILGFGQEGQATLRAIKKYAPETDVIVADRNEKAVSGERLAVSLQLGEKYLDNLDRFDVIIKSPGIPPKELPSSISHCTSATQIFLDSIAGTGAAVIGVTGSKGKSTTASLLYEILRATPHPSPLQPLGHELEAEWRGEGVHSVFPLPLGEGQGEGSCYLIGNIGFPALDFLDKAKPGVTFVMELSSYQLADLTTSPPIAVITSFFPEHLDYHGSLEAYREAKRNICRFQRETDIVFYSSRAHASGDDGAYEIARISAGKKIPFSEQDAPVSLQETQLIGAHNLRNIAAAWKVAEHCGIPRTIAIQAIREFQPLPHRLQSLGIHHEIEWVDDAISTTPESTIAALDAIGNRVATVILGGLDRGYDFTTLAERITHSSIRTVILFPGSGQRIRQAIKAAGAKVHFFEAKNMAEAVHVAKKETHLPPTTHHPPPICLLSTASPSYNMFKNFEEKGDCFQKTITSTSMSLSCSSAPSRKPSGFS